MTTHTKNLAQGFFAILIVSLLATHNMAQTTEQESQKKDKQPIQAALERSAPESDNALNQIKQLSKKVEQLEALVERQNQTLIEMQKQLAEVKTERLSANGLGTIQPISASLKAAAVEAREVRDGGDQTQNNKAASSQSQPKAQKPPAIVAGWDGNHAVLRSADGNFETNFTGYAQLDFRGYQSGNHPPNTFLVRRARLALQGKLFRYFDYSVEGDFADTSSTLLRDAYVRIHRIDQLQLTFGHFKEPFSQEELRSDWVQDFVERSLANNLAPSRSPGVMASGVLHKGVFEYQIGAFNGKGLVANNTVGTPEGVGRVRFLPWKNRTDYWTKGLAFGGAYALGRNSTTGQSVRGQTESRSFTFFTPDTVNGPVSRANGELTWVVGPASLRAEYDQVNQARNHLGTGGRDLPGVVAKGYMAQFTYLLTGENKTDVGPVVPKRNLFSDEGGGGRGAWELKLRFSGLQISDSTAKSNRANTIFFGANWYLNRFVRYVFDYGIELYKDPLRTPRPGEHNFHVFLNRVQVAF